jgi:hypothetical protein
MTLAAGFHVLRGEFSALPINLALAALAGFVAPGTRSPRSHRASVGAVEISCT